MERIDKLKQEMVRPKHEIFDIPFATLVIMLTAIGVIMMFSASFVSAQKDHGSATYLFTRQGLFALAGIVIMFAIAFMDYQYFRVLSLPIMLVSLVFLVLVPFIGTGESVGSTRWIDLGLLRFQPSEIAKLAIIMLFSTMISKFGEKMRTFKYGVVPFVCILAVIAGLLILEPHFSATILILAVGASLMFAGGTHWGWFAALLAGGGGALFMMLTNTGYTSKRIDNWLDPFSDLLGGGWQAVQSLYALGSGGWFGVGLGQSRQKYLYLPEEHNDFIFAVVGEELGFIGACLILLLFAALIWRGYWIALHARDRFGMLLVTGITTLLALQVFLNVAVVSTLMPTTGISLPFFSYGGTALIIQLAEMGIVLSVSRHIPAAKQG